MFKKVPTQATAYKKNARSQPLQVTIAMSSVDLDRIFNAMFLVYKWYYGLDERESTKLDFIYNSFFSPNYVILNYDTCDG